jgi:hypothetical protein
VARQPLPVALPMRTTAAFHVGFQCGRISSNLAVMAARDPTEIWEVTNDNARCLWFGFVSRLLSIHHILATIIRFLASLGGRHAFQTFQFDTVIVVLRVD